MRSLRVWIRHRAWTAAGKDTDDRPQFTADFAGRNVRSVNLLTYLRSRLLAVTTHCASNNLPRVVSLLPLYTGGSRYKQQLHHLWRCCAVIFALYEGDNYDRCFQFCEAWWPWDLTIVLFAKIEDLKTIQICTFQNVFLQRNSSVLSLTHWHLL